MNRPLFYRVVFAIGVVASCLCFCQQVLAQQSSKLDLKQIAAAHFSQFNGSTLNGIIDPDDKDSEHAFAFFIGPKNKNADLSRTYRRIENGKIMSQLPI